MFPILIMGVFAWMYTYIKTYKIVYFKYSAFWCMSITPQ